MRFFHALRRQVHKPWYPPLQGLLAALDNFIFIVPTDGLLVTGVLAAPQRWKGLVVWLALGSVLGGALFAGLLQHYGVPFLEWLTPGISDSSLWHVMQGWADRWGLWALAAVAAIPITQHPILAITALGGVSLVQIALALLAGRVFKYLYLTWIATHAPRLLMRFRPLRKEILSARED